MSSKRRCSSKLRFSAKQFEDLIAAAGTMASLRGKATILNFYLPKPVIRRDDLARFDVVEIFCDSGDDGSVYYSQSDGDLASGYDLTPKDLARKSFTVVKLLVGNDKTPLGTFTSFRGLASVLKIHDTLTLCARLPRPLFENFQRFCKKREVSTSSVVRGMIKEYVINQIKENSEQMAYQ